MHMDFDFAESVVAVSLRHARKGTPIEKAWPQVVAAGRRKLGNTIAKTAFDLPITDSLVQVAATYSALIARDRPGKGIKGFWFGLVQLYQGKSTTNTLITPYLAGAERFHPKDEDWPCNPAWLPEGRYAVNPAMYALSKLRRRAGDRMWLIDSMLIEPLNTLFCGAIVHGVHPDLLLGDATTRGIGCGFDSGELRSLGMVDKHGFKPISSRRRP